MKDAMNHRLKLRVNKALGSEMRTNAKTITADYIFLLKASPFTAGMQQTTQPALKQESKLF